MINSDVYFTINKLRQLSITTTMVVHWSLDKLTLCKLVSRISEQTSAKDGKQHNRWRTYVVRVSFSNTSQIPSQARRRTWSNSFLRSTMNISGSGETSCSVAPRLSTCLYSKSPRDLQTKIQFNVNHWQ